MTHLEIIYMNIWNLSNHAVSSFAYNVQIVTKLIKEEE